MSKLDDYYSERELMERFNWTKNQMASLRDRGIPVLRVSRTVRLYQGDQVAEWLALQARKGAEDHKEFVERLRESRRSKVSV